MAHKDLWKITDKEQFHDMDSEFVHDHEGNQYLPNSEYLKQELEKRQNSPDKEIALNVANRLLHSNLKQLSDKEKTIVIGRMQTPPRTFRELGSELNMSHVAVQKQFKKAKEKLKNLINQTKEVITNGSNDIDKTDVDSKESNR